MELDAIAGPDVKPGGICPRLALLGVYSNGILLRIVHGTADRAGPELRREAAGTTGRGARSVGLNHSATPSADSTAAASRVTSEPQSATTCKNT